MKINRNMTNAEKDLIIDGLVLEGVQSFRYLGTLINSKSVISEEIKSRIAEGDICFYNLGQLFRSRAISKAVKIKINKMMVKLVVEYGSETRPVREMDMKRLNTWEKKILRMIIWTSGRIRNVENKN